METFIGWLLIAALVVAVLFLLRVFWLLFLFWNFCRLESEQPSLESEWEQGE